MGWVCLHTSHLSPSSALQASRPRPALELNPLAAPTPLLPTPLLPTPLPSEAPKRQEALGEQELCFPGSSPPPLCPAQRLAHWRRSWGTHWPLHCSRPTLSWCPILSHSTREA